MPPRGPLQMSWRSPEWCTLRENTGMPQNAPRPQPSVPQHAPRVSPSGGTGYQNPRHHSRSSLPQASPST